MHHGVRTGRDVRAAAVLYDERAFQHGLPAVSDARRLHGTSGCRGGVFLSGGTCRVALSPGPGAQPPPQVRLPVCLRGNASAAPGGAQGHLGVSGKCPLPRDGHGRSERTPRRPDTHLSRTPPGGDRVGGARRRRGGRTGPPGRPAVVQPGRGERKSRGHTVETQLSLSKVDARLGGGERDIVGTGERCQGAHGCTHETGGEGRLQQCSEAVCAHL
mmetsp:Transcript_20255/g.40424  ORF Transcript_20255/g.40424 Transcript_20255/m.40424 type:complete len:216 (+) Transcript_20255:2457-3104(+)